MKKSITAPLTSGLLLVLLSLPPISSSSAAQTEGNANEHQGTSSGTLTFLSTEMPPFGFLKDGLPVGFAVEILHEIMERLERTDTIEFDDWKIMYDRVLTEPDTVLIPPSRTPEREDLFKWVGPLIPEKLVLFARKDSPLIVNSIEDAMKVGGIATVTGYASEKLLKEKGYTNLVSERSPMQGPDALKFGRVDLWLSSNVTMEQTALAANVDPNLFKPLLVVKEIPSYLAFSKSVPDDVVNQWQVKLDDMKRDGTWERIVSRWIPAALLKIGGPALDLSEEERSWIAAHKVFKVAFDVDWPPVEFADSERGMDGIAADYLKIISERLGVDFEPSQPRSWKDMLEAVEKGELDLFSAISPTPQRREWLAFTKSYLSFPIVIITGKEVPYIGSMSDLRGKPIAVVDGYASHELLLSHHPGLTLLPVKEVKEGLMALSTGKVFAFVGSLATASHVMGREGLTDLKVTGKTPYSFDIAMATRKDNTVLLNIVGKALDSISPQERYSIHRRWTSVTFQQATDYSLDLRFVAVALIVLAIFLYWNRRLKREVAERKRAEEGAAAANRAKSEFLANMSHELRTPLNAVIGFSNIVARSQSLSPDDQKNMSIIRRSSDHLLTLINDILDLSRIEAGKTGLKEEAFDLHKLLVDLELMFKQKVREKDLDLTIDLQPDVPRYVKGDQVKLRQVLINLVGNAVKFTVEGGIVVAVARKALLQAETEDRDCVMLHFEVLDTGPGIVPEERDHVFEAFGQTSAGKQLDEGTGLGLSLSLKFVQLMGGDMHLVSEVGKGSSFRFDIKVHKSETESITRATPARRVTGLEPGPIHCRMMIVDDSRDNRQLLLSLLKPLGFELREATNGQEALDILDAWKADLIWMDIRMPVMDGLEATRRIRKLSSQSEKQPVIIAVTASGFEEKQAMILDESFDAFIRKPFMEAEIHKLLQRHLGVRFVYEEESGEADTKTAAEKEAAVSEVLATLPAEVLETLKRGARQADYQLLAGVIEEVRRENALFADTLEKLAEDFKYDEILAMLSVADQGEPS